MTSELLGEDVAELVYRDVMRRVGRYQALSDGLHHCIWKYVVRPTNRTGVYWAWEAPRLVEAP